MKYTIIVTWIQISILYNLLTMDCNLMKCRHSVVIVCAILLALFSVFEIVVGVIEPNEGGTPGFASESGTSSQNLTISEAIPNDGAIGTIIPSSALISFGVFDSLCVIVYTWAYFHLSLNQRSFDDVCVLIVGSALTMVYFCFSFGFGWDIFAHADTFSDMLMYTMLTRCIILSVIICGAILFGVVVALVGYLWKKAYEDT